MQKPLGQKPSGGRGYKAVYDTKQMRIPKALEPQIQELIDQYRVWIDLSGADRTGAEKPPALYSLKPVDEILAKPVDETLAKPVDETLAKPVDEILAKPVDEILAKPVDEILAKPVDEILAEKQKP